MDAKVYDRTLYYPYGETWVEESHDLDKDLLGFKFTGKELDEETGLYYFGARYYDPVVSQWVSTDPPMMSGEYFPTGKQLFFPEDKFDHRSLPGIGGVYNSVNLNVYHYAGQNPVKLVDPTGKSMVGALGGELEQIGVSWGPAGRAVAAAGLILIAADVIGTAEADFAQSRTEERKGDNYTIRLQVQGKDIKNEIHLPISKNSPIKAEEAIQALRAMKSSLPKSDLKKVDKAFTKAEKWINDVAAKGGISPAGAKISNSFNNEKVSPNKARVDVEVLRGHNLTK